MGDDRYTFVVEWFDSAASLIRTYNLAFYTADKTIEMVTTLDFSTHFINLKIQYFSSMISKTRSSSLRDASTHPSPSMTCTLVLLSLSTQDNLKLSTMQISSPVKSLNKRKKGNNSKIDLV